MRLLKHPAIRICLMCITPLGCNAAPAASQAETFTAIAAVDGAGGTSTNVPLTLVVRRYATDAERDELLEAVRMGGTPAARAILETRDDAGTVQFGAGQVAIKHAYVRTTDTGRLITVITAKPIVLLDANGAEPRPHTPADASYNLGLVLLEVIGAGSGHGELLTATKVRVDEQGAIVTDDVRAQTFSLSSVARK